MDQDNIFMALQCLNLLFTPPDQRKNCSLFPALSLERERRIVSAQIDNIVILSLYVELHLRHLQSPSE